MATSKQKAEKAAELDPKAEAAAARKDHLAEQKKLADKERKQRATAAKQRNEKAYQVRLGQLVRREPAVRELVKENEALKAELLKKSANA